MNIGIDTSNSLVYEGEGTYGHAIWPSPVLTSANIVFLSEGVLEAENKDRLVGDSWMFREDSYDPISRIRRGRFYKAGDQQPIGWVVQPHPAFPSENAEVNKGSLKKSLETFYGNPIWYSFIKDRSEQPLVLLGFKERFTIWTIINVECISTGEDLVTLKARSGMGVLPMVDDQQIPDTYQSPVLESLDRLLNEVHHSAPISIIDRARDAASQLLLAFYVSKADDAMDLSKLANRLQNDKKVIAACAAKIIARLHARAKPVEKIKRKTRPIREQDAELAVQCVGTILCELGWADWV